MEVPSVRDHDADEMSIAILCERYEPVTAQPRIHQTGQDGGWVAVHDDARRNAAFSKITALFSCQSPLLSPYRQGTMPDSGLPASSLLTRRSREALLRILVGDGRRGVASDDFDPFLQSGWRGSNPRPQPWQGCILPAELQPHVVPTSILPYSPPYMQSKSFSFLQARTQI